MPTVHVLIGLPGSGKTRWCRRFVAERGAVRAVARDDVLEEMAASNGLAYHEAWRAFSRPADKEFRRRLAEAVALGADLVVDNTNLTEKARRRILGRLPEGWERVGIVFDAPDEVLVRRLLARAEAGEKRVAPWLVARMRQDWAPPAPGSFDRLLFAGPGGGYGEPVGEAAMIKPGDGVGWEPFRQMPGWAGNRPSGL